MHIKLDEAQLDAFAANGLLVIDNFLQQEQVQDVLTEAKYWQEQEAFKQAAVGNLINLKVEENYRNDQIKWINPSDCLPATKAYLQVLETLRLRMNREFFLSLKDQECMYAIYPKGSFYKKHRDQFDQLKHRIISIVFYLNENWTTELGGQLIIYKDDNIERINPIFNRIVIFKSELMHEVLPCHAERFSITGWLKDQLNDVNFL